MIRPFPYFSASSLNFFFIKIFFEQGFKRSIILFILLEDIELGVVKTGQDSEENRKKVFSKIKQYSLESENETLIAYNEVMNIDFIVNSIKLKEWKKNKEDLESLVSFLSQTLKIKLYKVQ